MILSACLLSLALSALPVQAQHEPAAPTASPAAGAVKTEETPAAAGHETPAQTPSAEAPGAPAHAEEAAKGHAAGGEGEEHESPSKILMHHVTDDAEYFGVGIPFMTKHAFFLVLVMAVVIVVARVSIASYRGGTPRGIGSVVETLVVYVRDEIAIKNIGHDGAKYAPLLLSFFFFILFAALIGLLPFSATSTGNLSVTLALAFISFVAQQYAGISKYGVVGHFKNLIPHGLPVFLLPVMIPIEILGVFTKPFALMIRLFANMLAGHMMITALLMLFALCYPISALLGGLMIPVSLGIALFIMCLEVLVAFIQAYVFTLFSAMFIGMYAHPSH